MHLRYCILRKGNAIMLEGSFPIQIIERTWKLQHELDLIGEDSVVLNDIATVFYGIPKMINEIRIIVSGNDVKGIVNALGYVLGVYSYSDQLIEILRKKGSVAINPVTIPVVYIVLAKNDIEYKCIHNKLTIDIMGYSISIPRLEEYISYMISQEAQYPYIVDAIALAILHSSRINVDRLVRNGVDKEMLCKLINSIGESASTFYELENLFKKAKDIYC